jgi:hypothetical protein
MRTQQSRASPDRGDAEIFEIQGRTFTLAPGIYPILIAKIGTVPAMNAILSTMTIPYAEHIREDIMMNVLLKQALAAAITAAIPVAPVLANKADDTLRVALAEEILTLDYNYTTKREYIILAQLTDATLFDLDQKTQEFRPAVATDYDFVDDKTVDVTLRNDVKFHDGAVLTAEELAYTYNSPTPVIGSSTQRASPTPPARSGAGWSAPRLQPPTPSASI